MLTQKAPPPPLGERKQGPSTELDHRIIAVLSQENPPCQANLIAEAAGARAYMVSERLRVLVRRGVVIREQTKPGGPARGPKAFQYRLSD